MVGALIKKRLRRATDGTPARQVCAEHCPAQPVRRTRIERQSDPTGVCASSVENRRHIPLVKAIVACRETACAVRSFDKGAKNVSKSENRGLRWERNRSSTGVCEKITGAVHPGASATTAVCRRNRAPRTARGRATEPRTYAGGCPGKHRGAKGSDVEDRDRASSEH